MEKKDLEFRDLKAEEIDVRVQQVIEGKGAVLLLYKDARVDMNILDETVGKLNWKKEYTRDNANCKVSIYDENKKEWVSKEDTGTESNNEAEKGLASDSFKRSCFCWGIGRELYTSPFIWVKWEDLTVETDKNGKSKLKDVFIVESIKIENKKITLLSIKNNKGKRVYTYSEKGIGNG